MLAIPLPDWQYNVFPSLNLFENYIFQDKEIILFEKLEIRNILYKREITNYLHSPLNSPLIFWRILRRITILVIILQCYIAYIMSFVHNKLTTISYLFEILNTNMIITLRRCLLGTTCIMIFAVTLRRKLHYIVWKRLRASLFSLKSLHA